MLVFWTVTFPPELLRAPPGQAPLSQSGTLFEIVTLLVERVPAFWIPAPLPVTTLSEIVADAVLLFDNARLFTERVLPDITKEARLQIATPVSCGVPLF